MYGFQKNLLKHKQHYKNQAQNLPQCQHNASIMLLRTLYFCSSKPNASKFALQRILKISSTKMILSACLPAIRPGNTRHRARPRAPVFSNSQCIIGLFVNLLFLRRFIHCIMVFTFIPYYFAFFLKKVRSCLQKVRTHKKLVDRLLVMHE